MTIDNLNAIVEQLQKYSEHPISKAFNGLSNASKHITVNIQDITNITVVVGGGIQGEYLGNTIKIGSAAFCDYQFVTEDEVNANVFVSCNGAIVAQYYLSDQLKKESVNVLEQLKNNNIHTTMLTGDSSSQALKLAEQLPLDVVKTGVSPDDKAKYVTAIQQQPNANLVLMVGDGINDSPVFAASDVSIAMGDGADVTKYAADIIILKGNLTAVTSLLNAAKQTRLTIKSNLYWSLIYNMAILPIAMLGYVAPYIAVIGMSASSILVVTNSLRLLKVK
jgi:Cu2+-exporting ATPase